MNIFLLTEVSAPSYTDFAVLNVFTIIVGLIFRFGIERQFVAEYHSVLVNLGQSYANHLGARMLSAGVSLAALSALVSTFALQSSVVDAALSRPLTGYEVALVALWLASETLRIILIEADRALGHVHAAAANTGLRMPLLLITLLSLSISSGLDRFDILALNAFASTAPTFYFLLRVNRHLLWWKQSPIEVLRNSWKSNTKVLTTTIAASLIGSVDIWIISATQSSGLSANYAFAVTVVASIGMLSTAVAGGLAARFAGLWNTGDYTEIQRQSVHVVRKLTAVAATAYLVILAAAYITELSERPELQESIVPFLIILGAGQVVSVASGLSGFVLVLGRQYGTVLRITIFTSIGAVTAELYAAYFLNAPYLVAATSGTATLALSAISNLILHRRLGLRTDALAPKINR